MNLFLKGLTSIPSTAFDYFYHGSISVCYSVQHKTDFTLVKITSNKSVPLLAGACSPLSYAFWFRPFLNLDVWWGCPEKMEPLSSLLGLCDQCFNSLKVFQFYVSNQMKNDPRLYVWKR